MFNKFVNFARKKAFLAYNRGRFIFCVYFFESLMREKSFI